MIAEGQRVAYVEVTFGDTPSTLEGRQGTVLAISGRSAHVQWDGGHHTDLVETDDLMAIAAGRKISVSHIDPAVRAQMDEWLDVPSVGLQVRATYDEQGVEGMITALDNAGHLATLSEYADEAVATIASRIRHDPNFSSVLAELAPDEADSLLSRVASLVLSDRITSDQED